MDLDRELNPQQREAVRHREGPLLILAGAGSGKTRVISYRIAHLIRERRVRPEGILAVTFTNKAAREMRERVEGLAGRAGARWISTFHAFGARVLRRHAELLGYGRSFIIYDEDDTRRLGQEALRELDLDPEIFRVERMLRAVERAKHRLRGPGQGGLGDAQEAEFYRRYQRKLEQANAMDFADLIFQTHRLWTNHAEVLAGYRQQFTQVLVDEFQDTDRAQYGLLRMLCPPGANICVVGDDDQSIYTWRDADIAHILGFERDYPGARVVKLERNYRSTARILEAASRVIARNRSRHQKTLWTEGDRGEPVRLLCLEDEREETDWVAQEILGAVREGASLGRMAVFYRTNAQSRVVEESFRRYGLPYVMVGGTRFFDRMEIRDMMAYLRLIANPRSDVDLLRVINVPARGIGKSTRERLRQAAAESGRTIWEVLAAAGPADLKPAQRGKLEAFVEIVAGLIRDSGELQVDEIVELAIERCGYVRALSRQGTESSLARMENLRELVTAAREFGDASSDSSLDGFLQHAALLTDLDLVEGGADAVNLMTLHSAKGLEFDRVFMVGMEEGLLPHYRSLRPDPEGQRAHGGVEEERRLCYVGMTRARRRLYLSCARSRSIFGRCDCNPPSRFLDDLPENLEEWGREEGADPLEVELDEELDEEDGLLVDYDSEYSQIERPESRAGGRAGWVGQRVDHDSFGRGMVRDAAACARGMKLTIDFESVGRKIVFSSYVRLLDA